MSALTRQSAQCDEDDRFSDRCASNSGHKHGLQVKNSLKCSRKKELVMNAIVILTFVYYYRLSIKIF